MAVIFLTGFEAASLVDNITLNGTAAYSTTQARTGTQSIRCNPASGASGYFDIGLTGTQNYRHFGLYIASMPSANRVISGRLLSENLNVRLNASGYLLLYNNTTLVATSTTTLSTGVWYWIGLRGVTSASPVVWLQVDGVDDASTATIPSTVSQLGTALGVSSTEASAIDIYIDDLIGDGAGFLAPSKVALLLPISDFYRDTEWTGGSGGTTNLYDAVNNTPPVGSATESDTTQIEHAGGVSGNYIPNLTTYSTAGVGSSDTIIAVQGIVVWGEDIATGTKYCSFYGNSNPTGWSGDSNVDVSTGHGSGAVGTYSTGTDYWNERRSAVITTNLVIGTDIVLANSPRFNINRAGLETRVVSCCFMGMYVAWTPASGPTEFVKTAADALSSLADATVRAFAGTRAIADSASTLSEATARVMGKARTVADALSSVADSLIRAAASKARTGGDTLATLSEAVARVSAKARTVAQSLPSASEAVVRVTGKARTTADSLASLSESAVRSAAAKVRTIADETLATLAEAVVAVKSGGSQAFQQTASDALASVSEATTRLSAKARTTADALGSLAEAVVRVLTNGRTASDALSAFSEAAVRITGKARTAADALSTLSEAVARGIAAKARTGADSLASLSEAPTRIKAAARTTADSVASVTDALSRATAAKVRSGADALSSVAEQAVRGASAKLRATADALPTLAEAVAGSKILMRATADALGSITEAAVRGAVAYGRAAADTIGSLAESAVRGAISFIRREHRPSD